LIRQIKTTNVAFT